MLIPDTFSRPYIGDFIPDTETQLRRLNRYYRIGRAEPNADFVIRFSNPDQSLSEFCKAAEKFFNAYFNAKRNGGNGCCKPDGCGDTDSDKSDYSDSDFDAVADLLDEYANSDSNWRDKLVKFVQNRDDKERLESIEQRVAGDSGNTGGNN